MLHVGFTGTRHGMTGAQLQAIRKFVYCQDAFLNGIVVHHGVCVGADEQFHRMIRGHRIVGHPGPPGPWRADIECDELREPKPFMARNADIVAESTVMIAAPAEAVEQPRGGTWSTIRMARKAGRPLAIVYPDGTVARERWAP